MTQSLMRSKRIETQYAVANGVIADVGQVAEAIRNVQLQLQQFQEEQQQFQEQFQEQMLQQFQQLQFQQQQQNLFTHTWNTRAWNARRRRFNWSMDNDMPLLPLAKEEWGDDDFPILTMQGWVPANEPQAAVGMMPPQGLFPRTKTQIFGMTRFHCLQLAHWYRTDFDIPQVNWHNTSASDLRSALQSWISS
ncbi:hypothetical protein BC831DRAFT_473942 [Entophlyctis helioformis]|nr:hypothetical protein BC831DRAFT_473942 [Entophlyctis helioformis]